MRKLLSFFIIYLCFLNVAFAGKYGDPNAPFKDVCGGKIKDKQDYDLTFHTTRVLRTTYFCEDGTEEYYNTRQVSEDKVIKKRANTIVEEHMTMGVDPSEIVTRDV